MRKHCQKTNAVRGQALIETCLAIFVISLVFAGLMQVSQIFAAKETLEHAAARGARARTVGFNHWMVEKVIRVAAIPNAGKMTQPAFVNTDTALETMVDTMKPGKLWTAVLGIVPSSRQYSIERGRIPEYLASDNYARSTYVLDYSDWDTISASVEGGVISPGGSGAADAILHVGVSQDYRLWVPLHEAFYAADSIELRADSHLENHYPLYLDDMGW